MEKVINKLNEVKENLINYIIDVANQNKLSYLFVEYDKQDNVKLYHIEIDNKFYITEDIIYRLKSFNIELLAKFCVKVNQDLNKVMLADNGHDYKLVNEINECYVEDKERFLEILQLIAQRDWVEIHSKFDWCDCYADLTNKSLIDNNTTDILTHICDDIDLECIIAYCRLHNC